MATARSRSSPTACRRSVNQTDFNGHLTTYTYDPVRNLETQRIEASGTPDARIEQRDAADALLTAIDRQYDPHGRLTQETRQVAGVPVPFTTQYRYTHGRLSGLTTPSGKQIDYTLDAQGRIRDVQFTVACEVKTLAVPAPSPTTPGVDAGLPGVELEAHG